MGCVGIPGLVLALPPTSSPAFREPNLHHVFDSRITSHVSRIAPHIVDRTVVLETLAQLGQQLLEGRQVAKNTNEEMLHHLHE